MFIKNKVKYIKKMKEQLLINREKKKNKDR